MGKIEPKVSGFKSLFGGGGGKGGAEVANSYKHVFGRDGRVLKEEIQHYKESLQKRSSKVRVLKC